MEDLSERLTQLISQRFGGDRSRLAEAVAKEMGIPRVSESTIRNWLRTSRVSARYLAPLARACGVDETWLTHGEGLGLDGHELLLIPIYDPSYDKNEYTCTDLGVNAAIPMAFQPGVDQENVKAFRIKNNSMSPDLNSGDLAFVDFGDTVGDGVCLVEINGNVIVRLVQPIGDSRLALSAKNKEYLPIEIDKESENFKILGRILGCYRAFS